MILILAGTNDPTVDFVESKMKERDIDYRRISLAEFFREATISMELDNNFNINLLFDDINIETFDSIWLRTFELSKYKNIDEWKESYVIDQWRKLWIWFLDSLPKNKVVGGPNVSMMASNKILQLSFAKEVGLNIPKTLISSNKKDAINFLKKNSRSVAKTLSTLSNKKDGRLVETTYTNRVSLKNFERIDSMSEAPVIFQEEIEKDYELRVTFVGNQLFPCKIESQKSTRTKVDWRKYDFENVPHSIVSLPVEISSKLIKIINRFKVRFGSFDMAVTPSGDYVFFEMNPNSQWVWLEEITKLPITDAFIDLLLAN
ncbi:MAG: hypothetical protein WD095_01920 [Candidatus Paceibacterota bacterium]